MRSLIIVLAFTCVAWALEPYPKLIPGNYYIGYTLTDQNTYNYEAFLEFHYREALHTFILLDGWKTLDSERNTGLLGILIPFQNIDVGVGIGNNYPEGSLFMTYLQYSKPEFDFRSIWQTGFGRPVFKTQANINLLPLQIAFQHISYYGLNVGLNLRSDHLLTGVSYNFEHQQVQYTLAIVK